MCKSLLLVRQPLFDRAALLLTQTSWVLPPLSVGKMTLRLYGALNYSHGLSKGPSFGTGRDGASVSRACRQRCDELVAETLVVPFGVIVHDVFGYRCAQVSLTERYEAVETLSTYGENESFRVCVQIRIIGGKAEGLHA